MDRKRLLMGNNNGGFIIPRAGLAAAFDAALGVTSSGGFASAWADLSGNGRNLLQATGANQPIHLPFAGTKYGYLPGVTGNYVASNVSPAPVNLDIRICLACNDWTNGTGSQSVIGQYNATGNQKSWVLDIGSGGQGYLGQSFDGSTYAIGAPFGGGSIFANTSYFVDGEFTTFRVTRNDSTGLCTMYVSTDYDPTNTASGTWTSIATAANTSGTLFDSTQPIELGTYQAGAGQFVAGKLKFAQVISNGVLVADFNPNRYWTTGTTLPGGGGETWTINSTGIKPAQIVDRPSLLFDGAAHYMKCSAFTLNQPETVYLVAKQVSWTNGELLFDGNSADTFAIYQSASSPNLKAFAGSSSAEIALPINTIGVMCAVFNGASSAFVINQGSTISGNFGSNNSGGFTLGCRGNVTLPANFQAYEALIYNVAHDAATRANIIRALMSKHGVA